LLDLLAQILRRAAHHQAGDEHGQNGEHQHPVQTGADAAGGPHGLSEIIYAYSSGTGNNGSAFAGINANTPFFNTTIGLAMLSGRFLMMIPLLAAAGSLAQKKLVPVSAGTFPTHGPLFVGLLVGVVLIVGALTYFPALSLGPIVEHFLMVQGKLWS
jgi:K+-transporting ATPase ATPase A chain